MQGSLFWQKMTRTGTRSLLLTNQSQKARSIKRHVASSPLSIILLRLDALLINDVDSQANDFAYAAHCRVSWVPGL